MLELRLPIYLVRFAVATILSHEHASARQDGWIAKKAMDLICLI